MDPQEIKIASKELSDSAEEAKQGDANPFGLDTQEMQDPIPHQESVSKFFDGQDEKNMLEIKQDLIKGLKRTVGRKFKKAKLPLHKRKMRGMNPNDIKGKCVVDI